MKCTHETYAGIIGAMDGEGPVKCHRDAVLNGVCSEHGGKREALYLNHIGRVDHEDVGFLRFNLLELFTPDELRSALARPFGSRDLEMELSVQLVTENTNGQLAARTKLVRVPR